MPRFTFLMFVCSGGIAAASAGCDAKRPSRPAPAAASPRPVVEPTATSTSSASAVKHASVDPDVCPGAVPGAQPRVRNTEDGVEIIITAKSHRAQAEIRRRADRIAAVRETGPGAVAQASCLVAYYAGTQAEMEYVAGGVRLVVTAPRADLADTLRRTARDRAEALAASPGARGGEERTGATVKRPPWWERESHRG
jgi:hypothetical protein